MRALILAVVCAVCVHACLPAPYIYITFHKGSGLQLVGAWTRDGCALPSPVSPLNSGSIAEPRGMIVRTLASGQTQLLLADAGTDAGRIMQFGACGSANGGIGGRTYQRDWVTEAAYPGLDHPYGIAIDPVTDTLYASNQDTNVVLGFGAANAQPIPAAAYLNGTAQYAGEFAQFLAGSNGVRGVTVDGSGALWIASEDDGGVYQFDATTGAPTQFVALDSAVGVHYDNATGFVYASSHAKDNAAVVSIDPNSGQIVQTYVAPGEKHPAGIVVYEGTTMYVVGQDTGSLFAFDVQTAESEVVVDSLGGTGEQIVFSPC